MKPLKNKWFCVILLLALAIGYFRNPFLRVKTFVYFRHSQIEESLTTSGSIPVISSVKAVNTWPGEHDMTEFVLFVSENTYYGCYYSRDDVPLAFQNIDARLVQHGHAYWKWQGEGDNRGATQKLLDRWYYFEASF